MYSIYKTLLSAMLENQLQIKDIYKKRQMQTHGCHMYFACIHAFKNRFCKSYEQICKTCSIYHSIGVVWKSYETLEKGNKHRVFKKGIYLLIYIKSQKEKQR